MSSVKSTSLISNPARIIEMMDSGIPDLTSLFEPLTDRGALPMNGSDCWNGMEEVRAASRNERFGKPHLRLHVAPELETLETAEDHEEADEWLAEATAPSRQIDELVKHLRSRQRELDQREADLQAGVFRAEKQQMAATAQLRKRANELDQHLTQVKQQQAQLVKLQQNLVDTQIALRKVIERIVDKCEPANLKNELHHLRFELNERVHSILNRWERIKSRMVDHSDSDRDA